MRPRDQLETSAIIALLGTLRGRHWAQICMHLQTNFD